MDQYLLRSVVALVIAAMLWVQARKVEGQIHRRRAFGLAAAALVCLAVYNAMLGANIAPGVVQNALAAVGIALFLGAIVSLALSYNNANISERRAEINEMVRKERKRIDETLDERGRK